MVVRHEVVDVTVPRGGRAMAPAILLAVPYRDVRHGQPRGAKLPEQRNLILPDGGCGCEPTTSLFLPQANCRNGHGRVLAGELPASAGRGRFRGSGAAARADG